jgi:3-dehydroquinate dehydratase
VEAPIQLRAGREFGGLKPLFCIPLVAGEPEELIAQPQIAQAARRDVVDLELANEPEFLTPLMGIARQRSVRVILAFHDFRSTPADKAMLAMIASMPQAPRDALRLQVKDARLMADLLLRYSCSRENQ